MPSARRKKNIVPDTIRKKIVDFVVHCGKTKAQVRDRFEYPYTNTNSIIQKYKDTGKMASRRKKGGAFRGLKVGEDNLNAMLEFVGQHPCATIEEICQHLWEERSLEVSEKTVCHALRNRLHITLKRVNVEHDQHNSPAAIKAWQAWVRSCCASGRSLNKAVFLDKAGFHLQQTRNFGRAPQGERMTQRNRPYNRGPNLLLLVAIDQNGLQASHVKTGAWNAISLLDFFQEQVLPKFKGQHKVFVLDNIGFHCSCLVGDAICQAGHKILLLLTYSLWFNIAEKVFAKVKPFVNRQELQEADDICSWIDTLPATITPEMAQGWLHKTNKWMMLAKAGHPLTTNHNTTDALCRHGLLFDPAPTDKCGYKQLTRCYNNICQKE